jgi:hypothetical protein
MVPFSLDAVTVSVMLDVAFVRSYSNHEPDVEVGMKPVTWPLALLLTEPLGTKALTKTVLIPPTELRHPRA